MDVTCPSGTKFFAQQLDHSKTDNQTFPQQYQVVDKFFRPGGPILFYQGAEAPEFTCVEYTELFKAAESLGGLAVSLEHRFFGFSTPFSLNFTNNQEWPTDKLTSLTLENVLLDSVSFVRWLQSTVPGAKTSKTVVFGGSYGGFLSTMLRVHHPNDFCGSITASGVFEGFVTSPQDPNLYLQSNWLSQAYLQRSASTSQKIRAGMKELQTRVSSGNLTGLAKDLNLCYPPNSSNQTTTLSLYFVNAFFTIAQYNYGVKLGTAPPYTFQTFVNATQNLTSPLAVLGLASEYSNMQTSQPCGDWNARPRGGGFDIPFAWILCTYFPYTTMSYTTADSIFGPLSPPPHITNINDPTCEMAFGIKARGAEGIREEYDITRPEIEGLARIVFSEGGTDPITALGPRPFFPRGASAEAAKVLFIDDVGHGADVFAEAPDDLEGLKSARLAELETIREWVGTL